MTDAIEKAIEALKCHNEWHTIRAIDGYYLTSSLFYQTTEALQLLQEHQSKQPSYGMVKAGKLSDDDIEVFKKSLSNSPIEIIQPSEGVRMPIESAIEAKKEQISKKDDFLMREKKKAFNAGLKVALKSMREHKSAHPEMIETNGLINVKILLNLMRIMHDHGKRGLDWVDVDIPPEYEIIKQALQGAGQ